MGLPAPPAPALAFSCPSSRRKGSRPPPPLAPAAIRRPATTATARCSSSSSSRPRRSTGRRRGSGRRGERPAQPLRMRRWGSASAASGLLVSGGEGKGYLAPRGLIKHKQRFNNNGSGCYRNGESSEGRQAAHGEGGWCVLSWGAGRRERRPWCEGGEGRHAGRNSCSFSQNSIVSVTSTILQKTHSE